MKGRPPKGTSRGGRGGKTPIPTVTPPQTTSLPPQSRPPLNPQPTFRPPPPELGGGLLSGPSFTNDILNRLPTNKRQDMLNLVARFRVTNDINFTNILIDDLVKANANARILISIKDTYWGTTLCSPCKIINF